MIVIDLNQWRSFISTRLTEMNIGITLDGRFPLISIVSCLVTRIIVFRLHILLNPSCKNEVVK